MSPSHAPTLWLWALLVLLLLALKRFRTVNAAALRILSLLVASQALLFFALTVGAAVLAKSSHNPSDLLTAGALLTAGSWLLAGYEAWLAFRRENSLGLESEPLARKHLRSSIETVTMVLVGMIGLSALIALAFLFWLSALLSPDDNAIAATKAAAHVGRYAGATALVFALLTLAAMRLHRWLTAFEGAEQSGYGPHRIIQLGLLSVAIGWLVRTTTPLPLLHDRTLLEGLREAVAHDREPEFRAICEELARRPEDLGRSLVSGSRQLRSLASGPEALSVTLRQSRHGILPSTPPSEYCLSWTPAPKVTDPELTFLGVLLKRGEQAEIMAWLADPDVPIGDRVAIARWWLQQPNAPRASVNAAIGKACVEARARRELGKAAFGATLGCDYSALAP